MKRIDITPETSEADLQKLVTRSYLQQAWMCIVAAAMVALAYGMLMVAEPTIMSKLSAAISVTAIYFSARAFISTARMRVSLRKLIELRRLLP